MFSIEKCSGRGTGNPEDCEVFGSEEVVVEEGAASDEVASAVAAVSDEIGDILKDEFDADRVEADRIGAELADLSAELGLLAGLADGEAQPDFASRFEVPFEWIALGHRGSGSGSSSSSWSGARGGRARRPARPTRAPRRRPIVKGKEVSRRLGAMARRAACARVARVEVLSDASDVGADTDSDDQWTELDCDNSGSSDSSSVKDAATAVAVQCSDFHHDAAEAAAPAMSQFLLPLLSAPHRADPDTFLVRHEDILQLLASAEANTVGAPIEDESEQMQNCASVGSGSGSGLGSGYASGDEPPVTPEEEAALLHYVCEWERAACSAPCSAEDELQPVEEWLLGVYHSWCEISALMYTLISYNSNVDMSMEQWVYRARFGCHCRLCLCLASNERAVAGLLRNIVTALAHGGEISTAAGIVRALKLRADEPPDVQSWDLARLQRLHVPTDGASIIYEQLCRLSSASDIARHLVQQTCECRSVSSPHTASHAVERFCRILENYKAASTISFKVEVISGGTARAVRGPALQRASTARRLHDMRTRTTPHDLSGWAGYRHRCDCAAPRTLCAQQRKQLLRISFFGMMQAVNELGSRPPSLQGGDQPERNDVTEPVPAADPGDPVASDQPLSDDGMTGSDSDAHSGTASLGLSTSSSLDSASELLLAAAAAVESGGSEGEAGEGELCRTVRHLMRSIASIERLMDRVLKHCDTLPSPNVTSADHTRKRVDLGLSEVDRKLMAMYRRLPEVHRRQLQVYRKQKKLSTVCMQLVGGRAPAPPPPGSPPPAPAQPARALCPEYHLQRFREVRRKVMHMRDQQLYYHRLRMWLEDQLRHERESLPETNVTLLEELPRRKRRTSSPKLARLTTASKRKLKPSSPAISKPHKILQMLRLKSPHTSELLNQLKDDDVDPPEAFPLEKDENTDTETVVGEKDSELCKDMKDCLAKFANFALSSKDEVIDEVKYPDSVSPPLQEMSPTTSEPMPVYTAPKPSQRLLSAKLLNRHNQDKILDHKDTQMTPEVINVPINACRTPLFYKDVREQTNSQIKLTDNENSDLIVETGKDPNIYKYVSFGIEIKKAMEECQNIINSYNGVKEKDSKERDDILEGPITLEQICEIMMSLDKNSDEYLDKNDTEPIDLTNNTKLAELVENMPQILANMPEIASKLSEFANASFELPEFASIMNSLPDVNHEAQLTPETLKQIRELRLMKRDNVKITKHTAKRKFNRRIKSTDTEFIETMTFQLDSKELTEMFKDEMKNKAGTAEDFKDLLFSISAQVVINKVFEYLKTNKSPELAQCMEEDKELFTLPKPSINSEMYSKAANLFENSVKDALSMDELRALVKSRFDSWKNYVATKFKSIPDELLDNEIEAMLEKFYNYIHDLAEKQCVNDSDKIIEKIDDLRKNEDVDSDSDSCPASKEFLKQIKKLLSTSDGNTFDLLIMKLSKMSQDKKSAVKSLKFKYIDVIRRCAESQQLAGWILLDPEIAANVIQELTGLPVKKTESAPDFSTSMVKEKRIELFIKRLREMNRLYMESLPKTGLTGDEWLVMLYRLEQLEEKLKESFSKINPPIHRSSQNASEAEILAAKGLSKIIGKANVRIVKKTETKKDGEIPEPKDDKDDKKAKNEALLAKCEAILTSKGEKSLLDSFYTIKSYITQGLPVPETYKKHVMSICSSIDAKLLDEDIEQTLKVEEKCEETDKESKEKNDKTNLAIIGSQNPELLAKYSAQALRNAKQTLNAVAFRNMMRNGQSKSESDACDTPKSDCKWTNDCMCNSCKDNDSSVCIGDIVKQHFDEKKNGTDDKKKDAKLAKPVAKAVKQPTKCENTTHQQHVCKVGHSAAGAGAGGSYGATCAGGAGEAGPDQPCTCCYCTVFGHAPPLTTPVPRNFNETRERLRSILNKKKQKCKTANGEPESPVAEKKPAVVAAPAAAPAPAPQPAKPKPQPPLHPTQAQPKPPALPKSLPPQLTPTQTQAQQKRQNMELQQKQLAEKMAKMAVSEKPADNKPKALQRTVPVQVNGAPAALKTEGKVNPNAMEQIRLQQLKQQQQAQLQKQAQAQAQAQAQQKPEPIYSLPVHNKPPQQQQPQQQPSQQQQAQQQQAQQQQAQQQQAQQQQAQQQQAQQQQAQQQQAQQQIQQQIQQQQSRRPLQRAQSFSSRDTSVLSTCSPCTGDSCWRESRSEDPRDLDALLQYIEGPARHVDRGKKRAKKQRQKAKRLESKLLEEKQELAMELAEMRREMEAMQAAHNAAKRRVEDVRRALDQHRTKKKGKKQKLNPAQQAKVQQMAEQLGELTTLLNTAAKEVHESEKQVAEYSRRLAECERELLEARAVQGKSVHPVDQATMAAKQAAIQQQIQHQQQLQQQQLMEQQRLHMIEMEKRQKQQAILKAASAAGIVRVRRLPGDGAVTVSLPAHRADSLATLLHNNRHLTVLNVCEPEQPAPAPAQPKPTAADKKQTWEQALAAMNQLAKTSKDKKKKEKESKPEPKPNLKEVQRSASLPDAAQTLSKKQRKLLAKQQAEEEEKRKQKEEEAKSKKEAKKQEAAKLESSKKQEKKVEAKKQEPAKKKEEKKETKKEKEKKGKDKQEKSVPAQTTKQSKQPPPAQPTKKEKKEQKHNAASDASIEINSHKACNGEHEKPASCSIMEQLSCGVQVQDLKLPPGITLTRVQPTEKKEPVPIKSVPVWKCSELVSAPTPVPRPPPVISAEPALHTFSTQPVLAEHPKTIIIPEPAPAPTGKSKKSKKKAKKAAAEEPKSEGTKMVTLRNPMFHPNLPPVQLGNPPPAKQEIRIPDPIPMPPNACQATITPTSNGMYTIRNPLMSMVHQQSLLGIRNPSPQINPMYNQPQFNYVNPNVYTPVQNVPQTYVVDPSRNSPKPDEFQSRIMNLASFTQKNDDGYSLFKTNDDSQQRNFLTPEYFVENSSPKPNVSPNPIGTRPNNDRFDSDSSLFANPVQRPEPIGTPLKREEEYSSLYTPFGQEERNVFRSALFSDRREAPAHAGDPLPYFQRLRVGAHLNSEVTVHHVTDSKFYKQEGQQLDESLFSAPAPWPDAPPHYAHQHHYNNNNNTAVQSSTSSPTAESLCSSSSSPPDDASRATESSVFLPDRSITNLSALEVSEREIESFKRFDFYFSPPHHKPKVRLDVNDIANAIHKQHQ